MQTTSRFLAFVALGGALTLAACGGSPDLSPVAATTTGSGDNAVLTSSGNGPGGQPSPAPGTGTCTNDCDGFCGDACTGPVGPDPYDIAIMLGEALQEEYKAHYLYASVLEDYAGAMPFEAIAESELRHVEALQMLFTRRQIAPPPSVWTTESFDPLAPIQAACAAGVAAEIADAAFYDKYLPRTDLPQDVRNVFTNLKAASLDNHLPAFERCQ